MVNVRMKKILSVCLLIISLISITGLVLANENLSNSSQVIFTFPDPAPVSSATIGHDYVLQKVSLTGDYAYTRPGRCLTPRIIVMNQGGDDIVQGKVPVEAWLGDTLLIPVVDSFPPLEAGKSAMIDLRYMIPHGIPLLPDHLTIKIDPWNTRGEKGTGVNEKSSVAYVVLRDDDWAKM